MHFQVVYAHLPRQRKLEADDLAVAANLIQPKGGRGSGGGGVFGSLF